MVVACDGGDERVAGVVVRRRGGDAERAGRGGGRARERDRLLDVEALGDEGAPEPEALAVRELGEHVGR